MFRNIKWALLFLLANISLYTNAYAKDFVIKPVGYTVCRGFSSDVKFEEKPHLCINVEGKFIVSFGIEGEALVAVDEKSLKLNALSLGGKDIMHNRLGEPVYKLGPFQKVAKDGKRLYFNIEVEKDIFEDMLKSNLALTGQVNVLTSDKLVDASGVIDANQEFQIEVGPYLITNKKNVDPESVSEGIADVLAQSISMAFTGQSSNDNLALTIVGDLRGLSSIALVSEGGEEASSSWSASNAQENVRTYYFNKPKDGEVKVRLKYWNNIQDQTLTFGF